MNLHLIGKKVFVSGSTSGIGFATAKLFCKEGASVMLNGRDKSRLDDAIQQLEQEFPASQIEGIVIDFADKPKLEMHEALLSQIDILVNNVGIYYDSSFFEMSDNEWYQQYEVNVMSGVRLSRMILPHMLKRNDGSIIFISSECASLVPENLLAYSTTKATLHALSRGLAQLTKGTNVRVNVVQPGSTMTPGAKSFIQQQARKQGITQAEAETEFFTNIRTSSLIQRFASEEEVASAIVYLASPVAAATNGSVLKTDGGSIGGII